MSLFPSFFGTGRRIRKSLDALNPSQNFPFATASSTGETTAIVNARIDWKETPEAHVFKTHLPGVKKGEVKVEILGARELQISGDGSIKEKKDNNGTLHRMERSSGRFVRRFRLPENSKVEQVKASVENGVLTVIVPKEEFKKPYLKAVQITAG